MPSTRFSQTPKHLSKFPEHIYRRYPAGSSARNRYPSSECRFSAKTAEGRNRDVSPRILQWFIQKKLGFYMQSGCKRVCSRGSATTLSQTREQRQTPVTAGARFLLPQAEERGANGDRSLSQSVKAKGSFVFGSSVIGVTDRVNKSIGL